MRIYDHRELSSDKKLANEPSIVLRADRASGRVFQGLIRVDTHFVQIKATMLPVSSRNFPGNFCCNLKATAHPAGKMPPLMEVRLVPAVLLQLAKGAPFRCDGPQSKAGRFPGDSLGE